MQRAELSGLDRRAVAERIRALLSTSDSPASAATVLNVDSHLLAIAIDQQAPYPTMEVLDAIVRRLGVDPSWLLTGRYDSVTHHRALEDEDGGSARVLRELLRLSATPTTLPVATDEDAAR